MATGGINLLAFIRLEVLLDRLPFTSTRLDSLTEKVAALCIVNP